MIFNNIDRVNIKDKSLLEFNWWEISNGFYKMWI